MRKYYLYNRDSKGKVRVFVLTVLLVGESYIVKRDSGILGKKLTKQPDLTISKGKSTRTVKEQAILDVKSIISKQRDKGYKMYEELFAKYQEEGKTSPDPNDYDALDNILPSEKTDASGNTKPMLAKDTNVLKAEDAEKGTKKFDDLLGRAWWGSPKLDGVRNKSRVADGKLAMFSKSGKPLKGVAHNFENDKELMAICEKYQCELDAEFYVHGMPLSKINGHCSKKEYVPERHDQIKLYIFDIPHPTMDATARFKILNEIKVSNPRVVIVQHKYLVGKAECLAYEKECIDLDYEGAMLNDTISLYHFGKRSAAIWKLKPFQDAEFTVIGLSEGLREEDMCFIMITDDGKEFKASIIGDREEKQAYRKNIDSLINKRGTVKFQNYTPDGIPFLPKFKCFRDDE